MHAGCRWLMPVILRRLRSGGSCFEASPGKYFKRIRLLCKCEALSSDLSPTKKRKKKKKRERERKKKIQLIFLC
jgi:hypothetical protein